MPIPILRCPAGLRDGPRAARPSRWRVAAIALLGATAAAAPTTGTPLAVRVARVIGAKVGTRPYMAPYSRVIQFLRRSMKRKPSQPLAARMAGAPAGVERGVTALVAALSVGASPTALRDLILGSINLEGHSRRPGVRWLYGNLWNRILLSRWLTLRSRQMLAAGHRAEAAGYARAGLLLWCQDSLSLNGAASLGYWLDPLMAPEVRQNALALGLGRGAMARLRGIYQHGKRRSERFYSPRRPFIAGYFEIQKLGFRAPPHGLIKGYLAGIAGAIREASGRISELYQMLRMVLDARRSLNLDGHRGAALKIKAFLLNWAAKVKANPVMPKIERQALLRWIKEASI